MTVVLDPSLRSAGYPPAAALPNRPVSRQGRLEDLRRARATAQVLRSAFPQLEQLRIELSFMDASSISPVSQTHTLYPPARAFFIYRCPHSDCDGEFDLAEIVRQAVSDGTHEAHGSLVCAGARPAEKSSKRVCELKLSYTIIARPSMGG